jgi:PKD repeat protein
MAHISTTATSGWVTTVVPGLIINYSCNPANATLTPIGMANFPALSNTDIDATAGPCHATFSGNLGSLSVLAQDGSNPKLNFIIGGGCGTTIGGPSFTATTVCQGQATVFTNTSSGATSSNWNFGDNTSSNQQNPTHTYANAGTYNVTLCINGSTTNCVQNSVTVKPRPPTPVITGPNNTCNSMTGTYSVPAVSGVTYTWSIGNGSPATATGTSVNITWNAPGGGNIVVTATGANGCTSTTRFLVSDCNTYLGACCDTMKINEIAGTPVHQGQNVYLFTPGLSVTPPANIIRVTATIISVNRTTSAGCGTSGPVNSYVIGAASPPTGFASSIPVAFGSEAIWHSLNPAGVPIGGAVGFPFTIQFPPKPSGWNCSDTLTFCVKYQITDRQCRTCEIIRCYSFSRSNLIWEWDIKNISVGKILTPAPTIVIVDNDGKPITDASGKATISIKPGTGARGASLSGQTSVEIVNGRATFRDLSINRPGQGYVLVVNIPDVPEALESKPFNVLPGR